MVRVRDEVAELVAALLISLLADDLERLAGRVGEVQRAIYAPANSPLPHGHPV